MDYKNNTKRVVLMGLFIALQIVLMRIFFIPILPQLRIEFSFLPLAFIGIMFGPLYGAIAGATADFIGFALFNPGAPYNPGLTLSGALVGGIYGYFLHKKDQPIGWFKTKNLVIASILVGVEYLLLRTVWLYMIFGYSAIAVLPYRFVWIVALVVSSIVGIGFFNKAVIKQIFRQ